MARMVARFEWGAEVFPLNVGRIKVAEGFVPPATVVRRVFGQGQFSARVEEEVFEPRGWGFGVHVESAGSEAEAKRELEGLQGFLNRAGDAGRPVYFAFRDWGADFPHEPTWGQFGGLVRVRVLQGTVAFGQLYHAVFAGNLLGCPVDLMIDAFSYGLWQGLATAGGGVFEEWAGRGGVSVGVRVAGNPNGVENKFTNPVFGHGTWDTGWTAAANVVESRNTEEAFRLFGYSSARLVCIGATNNTFTQTLNVGNTNVHTMSCYARLRDGGVISSAVMSLRYSGSTLTTRYLALEGGWYFLYAKLTGIASNQVCGVILASGVEVFADGFQLDESAFPNPLVWGDLPGAAWSGTAHDSTTTGAGAGKVQVVSPRWMGEGSVQVVVQCMARDADIPSGGTYYVFQDSESDLALFYNTTARRWTLTDGTVSINYDATFTEGDVVVFHATWVSGTLTLFVNGVSVGTGAYALPAAEAASIYVGSTAGSANQGPWVVLGFDVFGVAMGAADVLVFYGEVAGLLAVGVQRVSPVPWFWTKDGDKVLDNCDDSTRDNWGLVGGVGGDVEAETEWELVPSNGSQDNYWLMQVGLPYGKLVKPAGQWYADLSGSADANSSGGQFEQAVASAESDFGLANVTDGALFEGRVQFFVRANVSAGQDMYVQGKVQFGSDGTVVASERRRVTMATTMRWFYVGTVFFEYPGFVNDKDKQVKPFVTVSTVSGGTTNIGVDFLMRMQGRAWRGFKPSATFTITKIKAVGREVALFDGSDVFESLMANYGDEVHLVGDGYNVVWFVIAGDGATHTITYTTTVGVRVRPRWVLV